MQNLDKTLAKFSAKYPDAIEAEVLNVGAALAETKGGNLTEEDWDKIYKMSSKKMSDILKARESERIKKAREARQRGADTGSGGGTPGTAPKKETLKQAFERAQKELTGQKF